MSEQRNILLAILLSVGIFLSWPYVSHYVFGTPLEQPATETARDDMPAPPPETGTALQAPGETGEKTVTYSTREEAVAATGGRVRIQTGKLSGSIRLQGARFDDLTLSTYKETTDENSPPVDLLAPAGSPHPYFADFGWESKDPRVPVPTQDTVWTADRAVLDVNDPVTLTWDNGEGLRFVRTITVDENYMFTITQQVQNTSETPVVLHPFGRISREYKPKTVNFFILHEGPIAVLDGTLKELDYPDAKDGEKVSASTTGGWLGITDKYWLTALVPDQEKLVNATMGANPAGNSDNYAVAYAGARMTLAPGQSVSVTNRLFAGAKEYDLLGDYASRLGITQFPKAIDFGWFWFFTMPFTWALHHLYLLLGNMGLAILAFTVVLKIFFFPLANKSYESMSRMKLLTPEMKKLQERFKDDRARLNQEMMALYQKEKVNPLSGCLPIVLQIPVFFALYKVIFVNIDMRHAPFYGWITDLSARESITVFNLFGLIPWTPPDFQLFWVGSLALLMGITMWFQQRLNPAPQDPTQAKIVGSLPIIFTFILAPFASGLILYWTWNNILSILQQWIIMRRLDRQRNKGARV